MKKDIFSTLDLSEYLATFNSYLAREKPLFMGGDSKINYEKITQACRLDITPCENVTNLDDALMRISKQGVLHISEIYEFVKIFRYFTYLKGLKFEGRLKEWLSKIELPAPITEISAYFSAKGELKDEIDERFYALKQAYQIKSSAIGVELKRLMYSKSITPYLVDTQIHYINNQEAILVRGGFNHVLKGSVVARSSGGYFYVEPSSISKLKSEQSAILDQKEEIILSYCKQISQIFNKFLLFLKFINSAFDSIDAIIARALMAKRYDMEFVLSDTSRDIIISEFAHPALKNPKRSNIEFIGKVLLITGVNAGGKSMLLKSILSACLLSKYLLPMKIDASRSKIGTFKEFELIMEDPQNVKNDISTFAGRMVQFSKLFGKKGLLIGIDEIELGTDFEESASLYSVLVQKLLLGDVKMVITTHHKRLAMLLAKHAEVELAAALYDEKLGVPKYEFLKGMIGKSYAFETAMRYGIAQNIIAEAKKAYGEDKENLNEVISKTLNLQSELKVKLYENEQKELKLDKLIISLKQQQDEHNDELKKRLGLLDMEYYKAITEAKRAVNLDDTKDKQRAINRANELKKAVQIPPLQSKPESFKLGDMVRYEKIRGEIISISKNDAMVLSDGIRLRVPLSSLKRSGNLPKKTGGINIKINRPQSANLILDLHGLRAEEALSRLDKFISDALVVGFDEVIIKHGIGTGKLAYAVTEFLKEHPSVREFRDGLPNEGGFGSKVVKL